MTLTGHMTSSIDKKGRQKWPCRTDIRDAVRRRYAEAASPFCRLHPGRSCCGPTCSTDEDESGTFGAGLYGREAAGVPGPPSRHRSAAACPPPSPTSTLAKSCSTSARAPARRPHLGAPRGSPGGRAIGLDMTTEMLELARDNAAEAGVDNVEFLEGYLEDIPLPDGSVDVVLSNCVINLAADKGVVLREAARVLRPGGRFAVSDIIAFPGMDEAMRADMAMDRVPCGRPDRSRVPGRPRWSWVHRYRGHQDEPLRPARRVGDHPRHEACVADHHRRRAHRSLEETCWGVLCSHIDASGRTPYRFRACEGGSCFVRPGADGVTCAVTGQPTTVA